MPRWPWLALVLVVVVLVTPAWATFPTTSVLETCTEADVDPLPSPWATAFGANRNFRVGTATCKWSTSGSTNPAMYRSDQKYGPDTELFAVMANSSASTSGLARQLNMVQGSVTGLWTGYALLITANGSSTGVFNLVLLLVDRITNPTLLTLSSVTVADTDQLGYSRVGNQFTVYQNGTALGTASDGTFAGQSFWLAIYSEDIGVFFNNIGGGTIAGAATHIRHWRSSY